MVDIMLLPRLPSRHPVGKLPIPAIFPSTFLHLPFPIPAHCASVFTLSLTHSILARHIISHLHSPPPLPLHPVLAIPSPLSIFLVCFVFLIFFIKMKFFCLATFSASTPLPSLFHISYLFSVEFSGFI